MGILARLLGKQVENVHDAAATALINADPESALACDREALEAQLRKLAYELTIAQQKLGVEKHEVKVAEDKLSQEIRAAQILANKAHDGDTAAGASCITLMDQIEIDKARLEQEKQDVVDAEKAVAEWQSALDEVNMRYSNFQREADNVMRQMEIARAQKEHADAEQERQNLLKGMTSHKGLGSAMGALQANAQKMSAQAEAQRKLIDLATPAVSKDAGIAEAMKLASGQPVNETIADRLARLSR